MKQVRKENNKDDNYPQYRSFPLYAILICGLLLLITGLYLLITKQMVDAVTFPGRWGSGGGKPFNLTGSSLTLVGLVICVFPVYQLIKRVRQNK